MVNTIRGKKGEYHPINGVGQDVDVKNRGFFFCIKEFFSILLFLLIKESIKYDKILPNLFYT